MSYKLIKCAVNHDLFLWNKRISCYVTILIAYESIKNVFMTVTKLLLSVQSWAVFKYIYCIYTLYLNKFFNLYLITVFKYFWSVFKYMYLNTFLHTPLNINNRSSVDWSANHGFKHFNAVTCCICLLLNNTVLYPLLCYISQLKKFI